MSESLSSTLSSIIEYSNSTWSSSNVLFSFYNGIIFFILTLILTLTLADISSNIKAKAKLTLTLMHEPLG